MKRLLIPLLMLLQVMALSAQGVPFLKNYTPQEYDAHNINFDLKTGADGTIYFANFEGVMYYDHATWNILYNSGITRVTVVYRDKNDVIWTGGYNYFGRVSKTENGELYLQRVGKPDLFMGEVLEIWEKDGQLNFVVNDGQCFHVNGDKVTVYKELGNISKTGLTDIINPDVIDEKGELEVLTDITHVIDLKQGQKVSVKKGHGILVTDENGEELYTVTEANGLITNNVQWIDYDDHGRIWGATENGLFAMAVPSAFSRFTEHEGLKGEVVAMTEYHGQKYVGTNDGLFRLEGRRFVKLPGFDYTCWHLLVTDEGLLAATSVGVMLITPNGAVRRLTATSCLSLMDDDRQFYSGEIDGLWVTQKNGGGRRRVCKLEKISKIVKDAEGTIWLQSMYGAIWSKKAQEKEFAPYKNEGSEDVAATIVEINGKMQIVRADDTEPFPYPMFTYSDPSGVLWLTNPDGKGIYRWKNGQRVTDLDQLLYPFAKMTVRAIMQHNDEIWLGGPDGVVIINTKQKDPIMETNPQLKIRSIVLGNDSVFWGGYGDMPEKLPILDSDDSNLRFVFSLDYEALVGETVYRYRLNNGEWSVWADNHSVEYNNLSYGSYTFEVQARDAFGRESEVVSIDFYIKYPFYMRWYMNLLYVLLVCSLVYLVLRLRMRNLQRDKIRLEQIVEERTAEVRSAQKALIKHEKMATVGKLTQGLIDRILNPLNYINNFSKLSEGLVKDIKANIEDEEEHMDKENYEDTMDVLDMLKGNLQKVGEHGQNTTRTLKAMEEMLKDRSGGVVTIDLRNILRQDEEMFATYYAKQISDHHIRTLFDYPADPVYVNVNPDQLSKVLMNSLGNSVYAVVKKAQRMDYQPEIALRTVVDSDQVTITIYDTGLGIEEKILSKIFDPFFTTKTTGEAAGIGLYLSHEIIQNYGGDISARSVKDEFTEFTITLPKQTSPTYGETD